jgi:hypothetical protein
MEPKLTFAVMVTTGAGGLDHGLQLGVESGHLHHVATERQLPAASTGSGSAGSSRQPAPSAVSEAINIASRNPVYRFTASTASF